MSEKILPKRLRQNLAILSQIPTLKNFYLAGGTGCALGLEHRISVDLDFFSPERFNSQRLIERLRQNGLFKLEQKKENTLVGMFNNTRVNFLGYKYPLLEKPQYILNIKVAGLSDIGCMKIDAIASRGRKRDFIDLYFICQKYCPLEKLLRDFDRKYRGTGYNSGHILKSLAYFVDAEPDPMPKVLVKIRWHSIKNFFKEETKRIVGAQLRR